MRPPIWLATTDDADESDRIMLLSEVETVWDCELAAVERLEIVLERIDETPDNDDATWLTD